MGDDRTREAGLNRWLRERWPYLTYAAGIVAALVALFVWVVPIADGTPPSPTHLKTLQPQTLVWYAPSMPNEDTGSGTDIPPIPESITDVVQEMTEAAQDAVETATEVETDATEVGAVVEQAEEPPSWEDAYRSSQSDLSASMASIHEARGTVAASSSRVKSARDSLAEAEASMAGARKTVESAISQGLNAIDAVIGLLSQHRDTLIAARDALGG